MHWVLDVAVQEDQSRIRVGHAAQSMATVRRFALSLLEQTTRCKSVAKTSVCGQDETTNPSGWSFNTLDAIALWESG
jgi:hypothetical protein